MTLSVLLFVAGAVGGFLVGLLGIGGGLIYVALLHSVFESYEAESFEVTRYVLGNALLVQAVAGVAAAWRHAQSHPLPWANAAWVAAGATLTSMGLSYAVKAADWYRREYFLILFVAFLAFSAWRILAPQVERQGATLGASEWVERPRTAYLQTGLLAGAVAGLAGLAGGAFIIPWLTNRHRMPLRQAIAITILAVIPGALANALVYMTGVPAGGVTSLQTGYIVWPVVGPMVAGVLLATPFGVLAARQLPVARLRVVFGGLLLAMMAKLIVVDLVGSVF